MMSPLYLQYLDWDSAQLEMRCGLIDGTTTEYLAEPDVFTAEIKRLIETQPDIEFITIKLPQHAMKTVNALLQSGAVLIDTELTFCYARDAREDPQVIPADCCVVFCKKVDSRPFLPLAKELRLSRFFRDAKIAQEKALRLWGTSIKNHCEGFADELVVAYFYDKPCGLVTLRFKTVNQLFLHIVGVLREYQGKHIGGAMLKTIINRYAKEYTIYVETQSINIPAQIAYQKAGFQHDALKYILHYWRH